MLRRCVAVILLLIALVLIGSAGFCRADEPQAADEVWHVMYLGSERIGYGRTSVREETRGKQKVFVTDSEEHLTMRRFGQTIRMGTKSQMLEAEDGRLLSFSFEMKNPPAASTLSTGTVQDGQLTIETTIAGRKQTRQMPLDADVRSPAYQDRLFKSQPMKPGETRSFKAFLPELARVTEMKFTADDHREVKLHDGSSRSLLKVRVTQSILPGVGMRAYLDEKGETLRAEADLLGMVTWTVPREIALQEIAGREMDVAVNTLIRIEGAPANIHKSDEVVYRIRTENRNPADFIPSGSTQSVKPIDENTVELTVTVARPPQNVPPARIGDDQKKYLAETAFLQTKDPRVADHARKAAAGSQDHGTVAVRMEQYVFRELKKKNFSTALASAAEVAQNMEGDCTEHACLLAAMLRAGGIPSRVSVGLVYADKLGAFGGHMWTEAWLDGKWIPLDATLGRGGIGAGHIKVADADLSDEGPSPVTSFLPLMNLLSGVSIETVRVVNSMP